MKNQCKKALSFTGKAGLKSCLRVAFAAATGIGMMLYSGLDPAHLVLTYGITSAIAGAGAVLATNAAFIGLTAALGGFLFTQMTLAGMRAYRNPETGLGYFCKKTFNAAASTVSGATGFLLGGVGGMALAAKVSGAKMFAMPDPEDQGLLASGWNALFGPSEGQTLPANSPYDFAEISDAFEHFEWNEISGSDFVLGVAETMGQIQGVAFKGVEDAFKEDSFMQAISSPDFFATSIVIGCAAAAAYILYSLTSKGLDWALRCQDSKLPKKQIANVPQVEFK